MTDGSDDRLFADLTTPLLADACVRLALPLRIAPTGIRAVGPAERLEGPVRPVRHAGSVDVFLEAMTLATAGEVLVIDNDGRLDEGCIGDLTVLEARAAGLAGLVVWGCHRDTAELVRLGLPVFSYGAYPAGPVRLDPRPADALTVARFGPFSVSDEDFVFADEDGLLFVPRAALEQVLATARDIQRRERQQAHEVEAGRTLRNQLQFDEYLARRAADPAYTFRQHLRGIGGAIEE